jgi:hypothetical protein
VFNSTGNRPGIDEHAAAPTTAAIGVPKKIAPTSPNVPSKGPGQASG